MWSRNRRILVVTGLLGCSLACTGGLPADRGTATGGSPGNQGTGGAPAGTGGVPVAVGNGTPVAPVQVTAALTADQQAEVDRLRALLAESKDLGAEELLQKRKVPFRTALGYDPAKAVNLELIQGSSLKLDQAELAALTSKGFVISGRRRFPHFAHGYKNIYADDLPVFISADAILEAVHHSYDAILKAVELQGLLPETEKLLEAMRGRLAATATLDAAVKKDVDLFLAVALSLLQEKTVAPVAGATAGDVGRLFDLATAGKGSVEMVLFGTLREIDLSQFTPRGHYTDHPSLKRYFRALMWLGRIDFPMLQTDPRTGKQRLQRSSVAAALALRGLMDDEARARFTRIDSTVRAFVGEPDSMGPPDVDRLKSDLGLAGDTLGDVSDDKVAAALVAGSYGKQRILSQIVMQDPHEGAWPLDATFLFFGQRYVFDSHVFSNVVYDRVNPADPAVARRMMPDPLDVAYAALGNDQAVELLGPGLVKHRYAPQLEAIRRLGDEHGAAFWQANLYNLWTGALRALSPGKDLTAATSGLPAVAATEAWGRRLLSTQLASWAQLRHDTILYAKQSYTTGVACEFPDAYVDPYPGFFAALEELAAAGVTVAAALRFEPAPQGVPNARPTVDAAKIGAYFQRLGEIAGILRKMAEHQRTGTPHEPEQLAFINQAINIGATCGGPAAITGWYGELFFDPREAAAFDPTIADVHTQPSDEQGARVDRVLHVGTGYPRLLVMTVETCMGPRAYAGIVSSYHELVTENLERLDDAKWKNRFVGATDPAPVSWMRGVVVGQ